MLAADWKAVWLAPLDATWDVQLGGDAYAALLAAAASSSSAASPFLAPLLDAYRFWATAPVPLADLQPLPRLERPQGQLGHPRGREVQVDPQHRHEDVL